MIRHPKVSEFTEIIIKKIVVQTKKRKVGTPASYRGKVLPFSCSH